jgi:hypothetical protein
MTQLYNLEYTPGQEGLWILKKALNHIQNFFLEFARDENAVAEELLP